MAAPAKNPIPFNREKLTELRLKKGITRYELSFETGIEASTINRIENGESTNPTFCVVCKLAEFFVVPVEAFKMGQLL